MVHFPARQCLMKPEGKPPMFESVRYTAHFWVELVESSELDSYHILEYYHSSFSRWEEKGGRTLPCFFQFKDVFFDFWNAICRILELLVVGGWLLIQLLPLNVVVCCSPVIVV